MYENVNPWPKDQASRFQREVREDHAVEVRLLYKQISVMLVVIALVAVRMWFMS